MNGKMLGITSEVSETSQYGGMISPVIFSCMTIGPNSEGAGFNQSWVFASEYIEVNLENRGCV